MSAPTLRQRSRLRLFLLWSLFSAAAAATAVAIWGLYAIARAEIAGQEQTALDQEAAVAASRISEYTDSVRRTIMAELAGFHLDGLSRALRRWDESSEIVAGTFEWDGTRGFTSSAGIPASGPEPEELEVLWREFGTWRAENPGEAAVAPRTLGGHTTRVLRTLDNPNFPPGDLRYQAENIEVLRYSGARVDPWAGWAGIVRDTHAAWVFWYRAGPDAPVRGCMVDTASIIVQVREQVAMSRLARVDILWHADATAVAAGRVVESIDDALPGYRLVIAPGDLFTDKQSRARLSMLAVGLLFGMFLLGVVFLVRYSQREARDAERKTNFVSQVSHELRTPLTSIRMFADMLAAPSLPEEKRLKFSRTISRESERLAALIERVLTFNALERGKVPVAIGPVDVAEVARQTIEEMDSALREAGLRAEGVIGLAPVYASTDRPALKQALINVLDNAAKYAGEGGVVRVDLEAADGRVILRVTDRGPGIPAELRSRVFDPFIQGGGHMLTSKAPGLGLGLSIARGLLRGAGGDLVLMPGDSGAVFEIRMPKSSSS